jgi:hypothetical protein
MDAQVRQRVSFQVCLIACLALAFVAAALSPISFIGSPAAMDAYFGGAAPPGSWLWPTGSWSSEDAPFAYRVIFRGLVDLTAQAINLWGPSADTIWQYWIALCVVSSLSFVFAGWALDRLVQLFASEWQYRLAALVLWLALPSIHLAYHYPVQTKEDFLAYGLFFLGLRAVLLGRVFAATVLSLIGVMVRETLLLIPLLFLFSPTRRHVQRAIPLIVAFAAFAAVRLAVRATPYDPLFAVFTALRLAVGARSYDPFMGFREFNGFRETMENPVQTIFALFFTFGYGWTVIVPRLCAPGPSPEPAALGTGTHDRIFWECFPIAFALLFPLHVLLGRIVEIRISSLLAPWIVIGSLGLLAESRRSGTTLKLLFWVATGSLVILFFELTRIGSAIRRVMNPLTREFSGFVWGIELEVQLILLIIAVAAVSMRGRTPTKYAKASRD